ncbi:nucleotide kinase [Rhodococcus phage ReqiPine5]|uniref:Gp51 n=1 Tax=Rhodococcus phage ReqiPine5 TaxID=691963 RepID=D4P826_9CAUD|nr:nucleotide kinase [Rhodococcus phage ReqiPine5]ADD81156.1 gp51 [Rhodococcus phage ReqiPine5]
MTAKIIPFPSPTTEGHSMTDTTDHRAKPMTPASYDARFTYNSHSNTYVRISVIHPSIEGTVDTEVWEVGSTWKTVTYWVSETGNPHTVVGLQEGNLFEVMEKAKVNHEAALLARRPMPEAPVALPSAPGDELKVYDAVNQPRHYQSGRFGCEAIDLLRHCTYEGGNAIKYVWRHEDKGRPVEDLKKAAVYASWTVEHRVPVILPGQESAFFAKWNEHVRSRLAGLPDVYRAMDYLVRGADYSAIHLLNRTIHELTEGTN